MSPPLSRMPPQLHPRNPHREICDLENRRPSRRALPLTRKTHRAVHRFTIRPLNRAALLWAALLRAALLRAVLGLEGSGRESVLLRAVLMKAAEPGVAQSTGRSAPTRPG